MRVEIIFIFVYKCGGIKMKYVIGIDLGISVVKMVLVDIKGKICVVVFKNYFFFYEKIGYSE